jgi:ABC-type sulfate/molybdate transport systems ATPase subunit
LSFRPAVLLLDEPLSALDEDTRQEMQALLQKVSKSTGVTTLHVTHNPQEAETLADRRFQISEGRFSEID